MINLKLIYRYAPSDSLVLQLTFWPYSYSAELQTHLVFMMLVILST